MKNNYAIVSEVHLFGLFVKYPITIITAELIPANILEKLIFENI